MSVEKRKNANGVSVVSFAISDNGIGIESEKIPMLFESFRQADNSTTRKYGGSGLGLAITKQFSKMLGGSINVASEQGKGSTFTVTLPQNMKSSKSLKRKGQRPPTPTRVSVES